MSEVVLFRINDWEKFQHYKHGARNQVWIKVYKNILRTDAWASMSDAEKGQFLGLMLVVNSFGEYCVSRANVLRKYRAHTAHVRRTACLQRTPSLERFQNLGLITLEMGLTESSASKLLAIKEEKRKEKIDSIKLDSITPKIKPGNDQIAEAKNKGLL